MLALQAQAARILAPLGGGFHQHQRGFVAVFRLAADVADRLVQQHGDALRLLRARLLVDADLLARQHARAEFGDDLAVDTHPAACDPLVGLAARGQAQFAHALGQAHAARRVLRALRRWHRRRHGPRGACAEGGVGAGRACRRQRGALRLRCGGLPGGRRLAGRGAIVVAAALRGAFGALGLGLRQRGPRLGARAAQRGAALLGGGSGGFLQRERGHGRDWTTAAACFSGRARTRRPDPSSSAGARWAGRGCTGRRARCAPCRAAARSSPPA